MSQTTDGFTFVFDFAQPESYLALYPTLDLVRESGAVVEWLPTTVPRLQPPQPADPDDRTARHMRFRAEYREMDLRRYASVQGLELGNLYRETDSSLAAASVLWLAETSSQLLQPYVEQLFDEYWSEAIDIESPAALRAVLQEVGADLPEASVALGKESVDRFEQTQRSLRAAGAIGAPGYLVGGEYFLGRAHLPMVRFLLSGKSGPPPI